MDVRKRSLFDRLKDRFSAYKPAESDSQKRKREQRLVRFWPVQEMEPDTGYKTADGRVYIVKENSGGGNRIHRVGKFQATRSEKRKIKALLRQRRMAQRAAVAAAQ